MIATSKKSYEIKCGIIISHLLFIWKYVNYNWSRMEMIDCSINENIKFQWIIDKIIQNLLQYICLDD